MREYLLVMFVAAAVTYLISGLCRRLALRMGALAKVRDRDVHTIEMPYFGGVAMLAGVPIAALFWTSTFPPTITTDCVSTTFGLRQRFPATYIRDDPTMLLFNC